MRWALNARRIAVMLRIAPGRAYLQDRLLPQLSRLHRPLRPEQRDRRHADQEASHPNQLHLEGILSREDLEAARSERGESPISCPRSGWTICSRWRKPWYCGRKGRENGRCSAREALQETALQRPSLVVVPRICVLRDISCGEAARCPLRADAQCDKLTYVHRWISLVTSLGAQDETILSRSRQGAAAEYLR